MSVRAQTEYIEKFISEIKKVYTDVIINYSYDEEVELFDIWHNNRVLQFENKAFLRYVGTLIKEVLYDNNIYNFSFGYDYLKAKAIEPNYVIQKDTLVSTQTFVTFDKFNTSSSFSFNSGVNQERLPNLADSVSINYKQQDDASKFNSGYCGIKFEGKMQSLFLNSSEEQEMGLAS